MTVPDTEARGLCKCCYNHLRENAAAMRRNLDPAWIPKRGES